MHGAWLRPEKKRATNANEDAGQRVVHGLEFEDDFLLVFSPSSLVHEVKKSFRGKKMTSVFF